MTRKRCRKQLYDRRRGLLLDECQRYAGHEAKDPVHWGRLGTWLMRKDVVKNPELVKLLTHPKKPRRTRGRRAIP